MEEKKFVIDYPTEFEINQEITKVLDQGLPKERTFYSFLKELHQQLGWKYIFHDYQRLLMIAVLFIFYQIGFSMYLYETNMEIERLYVYLFISSPLLYGSISLLSTIGKESFEIEQVCKYTTAQISAYRMLVFSVLSIITNSIQILGISTFLQEFNPITGIMISLTSLFIFSLSFLALTKFQVTKVKQLGIIIGWVMINLVVAVLSLTTYFQMLIRLPYGIYGLIILAMGIMYFKKIKNLGIERGLNKC